VADNCGLQILVNDVNDNPPVFSASSPLRLSISETTVPGDQMATFQLPVATDADGPENNKVGYQLQPETDSSFDYFRLSLVNSSSTESTEVRLSLVNALDRETLPEHRLRLVAYDSGVPPLSTSLLVIVNVDDANDNRPVFDRPEYDVTVPETSEVGTEVAVLRAVDADAEANGRVRYRFSDRGRGRDDFLLDERSGVVVVRRRLDFARQSEYRLGVLAEDDGVGGLASFAMLTVRVLDENDHAPVVDVQHTATEDGGSVTVDVSSAAVDRFVAHISVTDDDGGDNGRVTCWLDTSPVYATDGRRRSRSPSTAADTHTSRSPGAVSSKLDRNQFSDDVTAMAAAFILVRLFEDEYRIQLTTNVTTTPDDMSEVEYNITVTCRDHGFPVAMTSSATIHVTIRRDDSLSSVATATPAGTIRPRFVFPTPGNDTVYLKAGLPVGHVIAVVLATGNGNKDVSLAYELVDGNGSAYFDVDRTSGHVIIASPLRVDNATLKLIIGVSGTSDDSNISMFSLVAELYVVTWAVATTVTSLPDGSNQLDQWSLWLFGQNWSTVALVIVVSCSLVLGAVLFVAVFLVCRKSRRGVCSLLRRTQRRGRKLTSSYRVAVEFTASDDGLNNVAMATASHHAPATSFIGITTSDVVNTVIMILRPWLHVK